MDSDKLSSLIEQARNLPPMTPEEQRMQAISFAFGNASLDNPNVTREMVEKAYDELHPKRRAQ